MQEICQSGSEGGGAANRSSYPYFIAEPKQPMIFLFFSDAIYSDLVMYRDACVARAIRNVCAAEKQKEHVLDHLLSTGHSAGVYAVPSCSYRPATDRLFHPAKCAARFQPFLSRPKPYPILPFAIGYWLLEGAGRFTINTCKKPLPFCYALVKTAPVNKHQTDGKRCPALTKRPQPRLETKGPPRLCLG